MGFHRIGDLVKQLRQVARGLLRSPGFTLTAVATMALSIGAVTSMFSVIEAVLLRPLPYSDPERVAVLWSAVPSKDIHRNWTSYPDIQDWTRQSRSFSSIAAMFRVDTADLTGTAQFERIKVGRVSSDFFSVLGVAPIFGRIWTPDEEQHRLPIGVISYAFWQTHFSGAHNVIGAPVEINHRRAIVVGVMPRGFDFPFSDTSVWVPLSFIPNWTAYLTARQADAFNAIARLKPAVSLQQAQQDMDSISARLNREYPLFEADKSVNVVPLPAELVHPGTRTALWMLFGAVLFLLLIACANVATLLLARQGSRERESAIRVALGARRANLIRLQMLECLLLSLFSGLPGLALAAASIPVLRAFGPTEIRGFVEVRLDPQILIFCLLVSLLTGLAFGLGPSWINARRDPHDALKAGGRTMAGSLTRRRMGRLFLSLQIALAMVLVAGTGLMVRSLMRLENVDLGYQPRGLLFLHLDTPSGREPAQFYRDVLSRLDVVPGVERAGAIDAQFSDYVPDDVIELEGGPASSKDNQAAASSSHIVSNEYFETAGVPLLRGRYFATSDNAGSQPVAIVNQAMAKRFWPDADPIGRRFRYGVPGESPSAWRTVVGVVGDTLPNGPESRSLPQFFLTQDQAPQVKSMDILVRGARDRLPLANDLQRAVLSVSAQIPRFAVSSVDAQLERLGNRRRFQTWLLSAFSMIAFVLAAIGTYGLISYSVTERIHEIGIRMALGATRGDVLRMILAEVARITGAGLFVGTLGALLVSRAASNLLFGVPWADGITLSLTAGILLFAALTAAYIPARRATAVDPTMALSAE
ncbi:MAG TPA: ABC transporter permease [Acidobacteriaceae bacterium]|nr:ABC transporter permease [Acidobacteriaceae bacterium]